VNSRTDPVAAELQEILFDYELRTMVVSSQVIDCRINNETAYLHKTLLDLERNEILRKVCDAHPESQTAKLCLDALKVQMAMLPVALNQQYLCDLLTGLRAPLNIVEDQTRRILQQAYVQKEAIKGRQ